MLAAAWRIAGTRSTRRFAMSDTTNTENHRFTAGRRAAGSALPYFLALAILFVVGLRRR